MNKVRASFLFTLSWIFDLRVVFVDSVRVGLCVSTRADFFAILTMVLAAVKVVVDGMVSFR